MHKLQQKRIKNVINGASEKWCCKYMDFIEKYPDKYKKHCNLFNEKEFEEKEPEIFAECCDIKHSSRLHLPKFQAV